MIGAGMPDSFGFTDQAMDDLHKALREGVTEGGTDVDLALVKKRIGAS